MNMAKSLKSINKYDAQYLRFIWDEFVSEMEEVEWQGGEKAKRASAKTIFPKRSAEEYYKLTREGDISKFSEWYDKALFIIDGLNDAYYQIRPSKK